MGYRSLDGIHAIFFLVTDYGPTIILAGNDPEASQNPALEAIRAGSAFYGEVPILGVQYVTGYEPIKDATGAVVGVWYVGYKK